MADISIIIPVYNAEKKLKNCIESILNQKHSNWSLILVDDGSQDNSGEICDEYARKDSRITVYHQKNSGAIQARLEGLKHVHTEFVTFVDADDKVERFYLDVLLAIQKEEKADIVCAGGCTLSSHGFFRSGFFSFFRTHAVSVRGGEECAAEMAGAVGSLPLWAKLYKYSLFADSMDMLYKIPNVFWGEDSMINAVAFSKAKVVAFTDQIVYCYRYGGFSSKSSPQIVNDLGLLYKWRKQFLTFLDAPKQYFETNLCQILNAIIYYASISRVLIGREMVIEELAETISDIPIYSPKYKKQYAFDRNVQMTDESFSKLYQENKFTEIKQLILKVF